MIFHPSVKVGEQDSAHDAPNDSVQTAPLLAACFALKYSESGYLFISLFRSSMLSPPTSAEGPATPRSVAQAIEHCWRLVSRSLLVPLFFILLEVSPGLLI